MCDDCYVEVGSPKIYNDRVRAAITAVNSLYEEHPTGGAAHIVTDDWNVDDQCIEYCLSGESVPVDDLARHALLVLRQLSEDERYSALAIIDGCWKPDADARDDALHSATE